MSLDTLRRCRSRLGTLVGFGALCCVAVAACGEATEPQVPEVAVLMDSTDYTRVPAVGRAVVAFRIANYGPGEAHFEGCPHPVRMTLEQEQGQAWVEYREINATCEEGETLEQLTLEENQAYAYEIEEATEGRFRITVFFGSEPASRSEYTVVGPEYTVH